MGFIFSSLGAGEILLVLVAALLLFGAERLPTIARALGRGLHELRRATSDLTNAIMDKDMLSSDKNSSEQVKRQDVEENKRGG